MIIVQREPSTDQGTYGKITLLAQDQSVLGEWDSIELPWRDNSPHYSSIPASRYVMRLEATEKWSPRPDGRLFHILNVPSRSLIKFHAATWAGDVTLGWHSDLLGCVAPGKSRGLLTPPDVGKLQRCVLQSRIALTEIMNLLGDDDTEIEFRDAG